MSLPSLRTSHTLSRSSELERVRALHRRVWTDEQGKGAAAYYTHTLRTTNGTMALRPLQAIALHEIATVGGLFAPIRVGGGKTLLSLLAPAVLRSARPLLILPASLIEKTRREMAHLMNHWKIPRNVQMVSYEQLGRESASKFLATACPDLILADEAHRLKNKKAGVTRRVARYMHANPHTRFVAMSGTLIKDGLEDCAHLIQWALKSGAPVPLDQGTLMEWCECLNPSDNSFHKVEPGPLLTLAPEAHNPLDLPIEAARKAFRARLLSTPGVVSSGDDHVACSIYISALPYNPSEITEANFRKLREEMETPDGWALSQAVDVWRHARELALGLHYVWDPRPPMEWLEARRDWAKFVREVLSHSKKLDTELQVAHACEAGDLSRHTWDAWKAIKPTFVANSKPVWHDDTALDLCAKWAADKVPGIIWCEHGFFARELARRTGLSYFGQEGLDASGRAIEAADPGLSLIASAKANATGRNLQAWRRNLLTAPPAGAPMWEQLLGRTHRDGQKADEVTAEFLLGCREHYESFTNALDAAKAIEQMTGHSQKILLADVSIPDFRSVFEWGKHCYRWRANG